MILPGSGINRIENYLRQELETQSHGWAEAAVERWNQDLALLDHFYADMEEKPDAYAIEKQARKEQYEPKITIETTNGGLFYLKDPLL
jgi:hypothetical protein